MIHHRAPPPERRRAGSLGLLGMRERAHALGGTFEITSSGEAGTQVTVRLPSPRAGVAEERA